MQNYLRKNVVLVAHAIESDDIIKTCSIDHVCHLLLQNTAK